MDVNVIRAGLGHIGPDSPLQRRMKIPAPTPITGHSQGRAMASNALTTQHLGAMWRFVDNGADTFTKPNSPLGPSTKPIRSRP
jgi:hypothetical protein